MAQRDLQAMRDDLRRNDEVFIQKRQYRSVVRPATRGLLVRKESTCAVIDIGNGHTMKVPWKHVHKVPQMPKPAKAPRPRTASALRAVPAAFAQIAANHRQAQEPVQEELPVARTGAPPAAADPTEVTAPPAVVATPAAAPIVLSQDLSEADVDAWQALAKDYLATKQRRLREQAAEHKARAQELLELAQTKLADAEALDQQIEWFEQRLDQLGRALLGQLSPEEIGAQQPALHLTQAAL